MASVSAGHIILTPTQPVGSGRPQQESNPGPPLQESRALSMFTPAILKSLEHEAYRAQLILGMHRLPFLKSALISHELRRH